jgi:hypothetical protein
MGSTTRPQHETSQNSAAVERRLRHPLADADRAHCGAKKGPGQIAGAAKVQGSCRPGREAGPYRNVGTREAFPHALSGEPKTRFRISILWPAHSRQKNLPDVDGRCWSWPRRFSGGVFFRTSAIIPRRSRGGGKWRSAMRPHDL